MDEFRSRQLRKPWNDLIPLHIPTSNGFPWFQSGAGFRPLTVWEMYSPEYIYIYIYMYIERLPPQADVGQGFFTT